MVDITTIREWKYRFEKYGTEGLRESSTWNPYTKELKLSAINDYLSDKYSIREITKKNQISNHSVLRKWIKKYNSHRDLKDSSKGSANSMAKGRKTTWEERIRIVLDCLGNGKDYKETSETHEVSYQQVYQWVKKYEIGGDEALKDKRGRTKVKEELTPEEEIKFQMKK